MRVDLQKVWSKFVVSKWLVENDRRRGTYRQRNYYSRFPPSATRIAYSIVHSFAGNALNFRPSWWRVDGGSGRIRSDPPRTLADFLCPHKVRLSPRKKGRRRTPGRTLADSGGLWRIRLDPRRTQADNCPPVLVPKFQISNLILTCNCIFGA